MALIKCPECGKEVSDKANSCIYCGFPVEIFFKVKSEHRKIALEEKKKTMLIQARQCDRCGKFVKSDSGFCGFCGNKMKDLQIEITDEEVDKFIKSTGFDAVKRCRGCRRIIDAYSLYCGYCGLIANEEERKRKIQLDTLRLHLK